MEKKITKKEIVKMLLKNNELDSKDEEEMRAKAVETIEKESGSRFDPEVTKIFVQISKQFSLPQM